MSFVKASAIAANVNETQVNPPPVKDTQKSKIVNDKRFVEILDIIQSAYYDIYADQAGVTNKRFREAASELGDPTSKAIYDKGRVGIPMNLSIAEPTKVGN